MSCSTTSLSACTIKKTLTSEDPYVFTETAPTTPPILFNNSQKSRNRLVVKNLNLSSTATIDKTPTTAKNSSFSKVKSNGVKTQTPSSVSVKASAINTSAVLGVLNTNNIKYGPQSSKPQLESNQSKHTQHVLLAQNENAAALSTLVASPTTASIINSRNLQQQKPQIQQKTQQYNQHHQQQQQSQTPPPLLLSHTPSLWQTPLLLDSPKATESSTTNTTTTTTSTTGLLKNNTASTTFVSSVKHSPIKISFQPPNPTLAATALITPISIPAVTMETTTTTTCSIAPLHLIMPSAAPLPPSNFHNTTLAQHLQKVQCLKKSKKSNSPSNTANIAIQKTETTSKGLDTMSSSTVPALKSTSKNTTQHSTTDLNEIPVNVIFRSPTKAKNVDCNSHKKNITPTNVVNCDNKMENHQINNIKRLPTEFSSETISSKKLVGTESISIHKQSSKSAQKRKNSSIVGSGQVFSTSVSQPKQRKLQTKIKSIVQPEGQKLGTSELLKNNPNTLMDVKSKPGIDNLSNKAHKVGINRKTNQIVQKTQKRNCKVNLFSKSIAAQNQSEFLMIDDVSSTTKAVAVIRMPYKEIAADISLLAEDSVLPYCVQRHWFNINERSIRSTSVGREERIVEYKNLLTRQAMQLLATRSLQQLPFHIARKRLLCVDALLRKYRDHNKTAGDGTTTKRCEVESCSNAALEKTTYCRQHIIKNTKQCIFVQCSAKSLKDNQKPCDVPVLNIKKPYSVPLCYLHAAYQQRNSCNTIKTATAINQSTLNPQFAMQSKSSKRVVAAKNPSSCRKRKTATTIYDKNSLNVSNLSNFNAMKADTLPMGSVMSLQRKNSITSLESIASNSHSSFASSIQQRLATESSTIAVPNKQQISKSNAFQTNMLSPPSLAPLSYNNRSVNNHVGSNNSAFANSSQRENFNFGNGTLDPTAEQEINKLVAQFAMVAEATSAPTNNNNSCNVSGNNNNNNNNNNIQSFNYLNTNSNSNLTSSGVGSSSSLPSTDELLTQDMLSICENSSAYASSSEDTGLGELSENELIGTGSGGGGVGVGCGSGFNDDDVSPDEIPLGDTRLLEENDLVNVFGTLPVNLNELFTTVVRQDEREEIERALEIADKHLKTLQETIGSDSDFLADFLDVNDDMLADTDDICNKMEIVSSVLSPSESLEAPSLYLENTNNVPNVNQHGTKNVAITGNCVNAGTSNNSGVMDIRGLLQT